MTTQRKLTVYQKTRDANAPIGETRCARESGLHLDDLRQIEATLESAALAALKVHGSHRKLPGDMSPERVARCDRLRHLSARRLILRSIRDSMR